MKRIVSDNNLYSKDYKLYVGMTREDLKYKCNDESARAARKLQKAFERADGCCSGWVKDGVISEDEIMQYNRDLEDRKERNLCLGLVGAFALFAVGICIFQEYEDDIVPFFKDKISSLKYKKYERDVLRAFKK